MKNTLVTAEEIPYMGMHKKISNVSLNEMAHFKNSKMPT
jgi:hypothetical protein